MMYRSSTALLCKSRTRLVNLRNDTDNLSAYTSQIHSDISGALKYSPTQNHNSLLWYKHCQQRANMFLHFAALTCLTVNLRMSSYTYQRNY